MLVKKILTLPPLITTKANLKFFERQPFPLESRFTATRSRESKSRDAASWHERGAAEFEPLSSTAKGDIELAEGRNTDSMVRDFQGAFREQRCRVFYAALASHFVQLVYYILLVEWEKSLLVETYLVPSEKNSLEENMCTEAPLRSISAFGMET